MGPATPPIPPRLPHGLPQQEAAGMGLGAWPAAGAPQGRFPSLPIVTLHLAPAPAPAPMYISPLP